MSPPMSDHQPSEAPRVVERPVEDAKRYARRRYALFVVHLFVGVAFLTVMITGGSEVLAREAEYLGGGSDTPLTVFYYFAGFSLAYFVLTLPLTFYGGYLLERRFGLSTQTPGGWLRRRLKKWAVSFAVATPVVLACYAMLRAWPRTWWLPAAGLWILVSYVLAKMAPVVLMPLFFKLDRIRDDELASRLSKLASKAGLRLRGVWRIDLSRETKKANAAVVGLGSTRRVVLGDTLLAAFHYDEVGAVFAHELGHIVHHHLLKGFVLASALTACSLYAGSVVLARAAASMGVPVHDVRTLPVLVAVAAAIQLLVMPFQKWYSRRCELESDEYALRVTRDRDAFISAMKKLGAMNLADVRPNRLAEILLFSHPPIWKRIRFARELDLGTTG